MRDFVIDISQPIEDGKTVRINCPECGGENSFTATTNGNSIVYNCYRAGCDKTVTSGKVFIRLSHEEWVKKIKTRKQREDVIHSFVVPHYWIDGIGNAQCLEYMQSKHMMGAYHDKLFRPMYDTAERRFVFPIRNNAGEVIGGIGRTLIGQYPKALNYNRSYTQPFICGKGRKIALLVEDCASAVAATRNPLVAGVALLGTSLRDDFIPHLSPYDWVGIALDPDAYSKSLKIKKHLTSYVKDVRVLKLKDDIKDLTDEEYESFCREQF